MHGLLVFVISADFYRFASCVIKILPLRDVIRFLPRVCCEDERKCTKLFFELVTMPPKSAKKRQVELSLQKAREEKRRRTAEETSAEVPETAESSSGAAAVELSDMIELLSMSDDALDTDNEDVDPSFDLDASTKSDGDYMVKYFCENWISHLDQDNLVSLGLFLSSQLANHLNIGNTKAAELASAMMNKSDKTIREWRAHFFANEGEIPESSQGTYQRSGIMWSREDLNKKTTKYIRENADVKGRPNLTARQFCNWVNKVLLPNETLEPGFPRNTSIETGRKWMHELGFEVLSKKKGTFVDGHERNDVVEYRTKFLCRMVSLGFLNPNNAPRKLRTHCLLISVYHLPMLLKRWLFSSMMKQPFKQMKINLPSGLSRVQV